MPTGFFAELSMLEERPVTWLNHFVFKWPVLDLFLTWLVNADIAKFVPMLLVICWLWFEGTPRQTFNRQTLVEAIFAGFAALVIGRLLAFSLPFRDRPLVKPDLHLAIPFDTTLRTWSSFPSDHAVMAFALAASLYRVSPKFGIWAYLHSFIVICLPRLLFGLHYPSDLIGGALIGIGVALATAQLQPRHAVAGYLLGIEHKYPAMFYAIGFFALFEIAEMFESVREVVGYIFRAWRQV